MDLTNIAGAGDIVDSLKDKVTDAVTENIGEKVADMVQGPVDAVEAMADKVGLGEVFDKAVDAVEDKIGVDVDGDGDKGVL